MYMYMWSTMFSYAGDSNIMGTILSLTAYSMYVRTYVARVSQYCSEVSCRLIDLFRAGRLSIIQTRLACQPESNTGTASRCIAPGNIASINIKAGRKIDYMIVGGIISMNGGRVYCQIVQSFVVQSSDLES